MSRKLIFSMFSLFLGAAATQAATTIVTPGTGTLKTAVDAAVNGDVLLLQTGNYNLSAQINVDVGITIRPQDGSQHPRIILNDFTMTLNHTTGTTTLQKLDFAGGGTVRTSNAKVLNILENTFTDVQFSLNSTTGPCYIIGNNTQRSSSTVNYRVELDADCYVGGNNFDGVGSSFSANSGYFIGNKVRKIGSNGIVLYAAYAIGNEFIRDWDATTSSPSPNVNYNIVNFYSPQQTGLRSNWPLIANNIFRVIGSPGTAPSSPIKSMTAADLVTNSQLYNNVIDHAQFRWPTQGDWGMIYVQKNSTVQGNIVINGSNNSMPAIAFINDTERTQSDVSFNDCHNNASDCGNTNGNINLDPDFVDSIDYVLSPGSSPALDAGPANEHLNDLDGSRNDMGVHGSPHPIAQYKDQLAPAVTAPYVYPVFNEVQTLSGAQVEVTAIGVARFK